MKLIFGLACDARVYPDFPGERDGVFDAAVVGPAGLIDALELQLGLTGPLSAKAVRIAAYAAKLRAELGNASDRFFAASFAQDPWATAKMLLGWRDQLIAAGWSAEPSGERRPDDLARIEREVPQLPRGLDDRLRSLIDTLQYRPALTIDRVTLVEDRKLLPPAWGQLIDAIEFCGAAVRQRMVPVGAAPATDLRKAQTFLSEGAVAELNGDGTFVIVEADTAVMAAEALAEWLAAGSEEELSGTVVLTPDGDTAFLDRTMQARGLPALGQSLASPWRGALQVLPLAFAAAWTPFNPKPLLDLLLLPRPPIGRSAARKLARALTREPGTGAAAWQSAWTEIESDLAERFADHPAPAAEIKKRLTRWREWTTGGLYNRLDGIPAEKARLIASRVSQWAVETDGGEGDPLLLAVAGAATALAEAIDVLGQDPLPALLVERILEQVLADGAQNPDHFATAGGLRCVTDPAALWAPAARVIWWDFKGPGARVPQSPWSHAELAALAGVGCRVETAADCAARIGWSYANAVRMVTDRLILIHPSLSAGEETISHPLAHQLTPLTRPADTAIRWNAERLVVSASHTLAGRTLIRQAQAILPLPLARAQWNLPSTAIAQLEGRRESATSFERMVDCQLRWVLQDVLRLSGGRFAEIPGPDQLLGNLAHEIANQVFRPGSVASGDDILRQANEIFDALLGEIAAPLQQPEFAGEMAAARSRVPQAIAQLANSLRQKGLDVVGTELERARDFDNGLSVVGRLDLLVRHPSRGLGVIDLKWSRSARRRRDEVTEGRALQLATYGAIADSGGGTAVPGAYYLLNQRRLIGPRGLMVADEEMDATRSLGDTWIDLVTTWRAWRALAAEGSVLAMGVPEAVGMTPGTLIIRPGENPCRYCELTSLCRIGEEAV